MALYTEKYLRAASEFNDKRLGVQFGKLCIQANLPPSMIAKALHVSRMSVYNWFKGNPLRGKNISKIERAIDIIEKHLELHTLPAQTVVQAKEFIYNNIADNI
jgi:predicted transcriptional regulator|tara:strand:+ start:3955 stop:4263 length:309 start_codon:yes stop_codon:yes gene_type:complete